MQNDLNFQSHLVCKFLYPSSCDFVYSTKHIDIWQYSLSNEHTNAHLLLNQEELNRANRYYFPKHRRRFIVARATMRLILSRYLKINPKDIEFTHNAYGKPALLNEPSLQFNLSHSGELALFAIGKTHPIGIDLEFFSQRPYDGIAKEMFSPQENALFSLTPKSLKTLTFFHVWAQKEAFIKVCGMGLSYPTKEFTVPLHMPIDQIIWDPRHQITYKMTSFMPEMGCPAAICYHPTIQTIRYYKWHDT